MVCVIKDKETYPDTYVDPACVALRVQLAFGMKLARLSCSVHKGALSGCTASTHTGHRSCQFLWVFGLYQRTDRVLPRSSCTCATMQHDVQYLQVWHCRCISGRHGPRQMQPRLENDWLQNTKGLCFWWKWQSRSNVGKERFACGVLEHAEAAETVYLQLLIWFSQLFMPFVVPSPDSMNIYACDGHLGVVFLWNMPWHTMTRR